MSTDALLDILKDDIDRIVDERLEQERKTASEQLEQEKKGWPASKIEQLEDSERLEQGEGQPANKSMTSSKMSWKPTILRQGRRWTY